VYRHIVPRKILLLVTDLEIGGTPTVVRELAVRLNGGDVTVEVACLSQWGPVAEELKQAGVTVHALAATSVRDVTVIARTISLIRRRGYDTVFSFLIHANVVAAIALRFAEFRLIQSIQTTQPGPRWHWWMQRLVRHAAEKIVVPSESAARVARERSHVAGEKIVVIPNAVEADAFSASTIPAADPRPYPIGFIGRLDPVKRVPFLVRAMVSVKQRVHLHIFGEGQERAEIAAAIQTYGLGTSVTMHGAVARPQMALEQIGCLVLPSIAEGFGLVLIEAMAAGVPVIGTDVPGIREIVRDGETGILAPAHDEVALAGAIDRVVEDGQLRARLIQRARSYVREHFVWEKILPRYRALLGV